MTHSLSPYPASVTIKPIADGSQVFQHGRYRGYVEKRNNWGVEWVARPEEGECRVFKEKVKAVRYLLLDEEEYIQGLNDLIAKAEGKKVTQ